MALVRIVANEEFAASGFYCLGVVLLPLRVELKARSVVIGPEGPKNILNNQNATVERVF